MVRPVIVEQSVDLDELHRAPGEHARRLRESGQPAVMAAGDDELVVLHKDLFTQLMEELDVLETRALLIRRSERAQEEGGGRPAREVFEELARKHGFRLGESDE